MKEIKVYLPDYKGEGQITDAPMFGNLTAIHVSADFKSIGVIIECDESIKSLFVVHTAVADVSIESLAKALDVAGYQLIKKSI